MREVSGLYIPGAHWKQTKPGQYEIEIPSIGPFGIHINPISDLVEVLKLAENEIDDNYNNSISCNINYPLIENIPKGIFAFRVKLKERKEGNLENLIMATKDLFIIAGVTHIPEEGIDIMNEAFRRYNHNRQFKEKILGGYKLVEMLQESAPLLGQ